MIPVYTQINQPDLHLLVCHDRYNRRIRVDELEGNLQAGLSYLSSQTPAWAEKVIVKARPEQVGYLAAQGWVQEAEIPCYFNGGPMYFMVDYPLADRSCSDQTEEERNIVQTILRLKRNPVRPVGQNIKRSTARDAERLASLYDAVFAIYPTPLGDPSYIRKTMGQGTVYVHVEEEGKILSAASAEVNRKFANAELTDCATLDSEQGKGYMALLLARLEEILMPEAIACLYTICRAQSFGMNKVFYNLGYDFGGCLVNNCNIYTGLENMNVWHKRIN